MVVVIDFLVVTWKNQRNTMTQNSKTFIDDVNKTQKILREVSVNIAKYLTTNESSLHDSAKKDLHGVIGALTVQISGLQSCLIEADMETELKLQLLANAKLSIKQSKDFLTDAEID